MVCKAIKVFYGSYTTFLWRKSPGLSGRDHYIFPLSKANGTVSTDGHLSRVSGFHRNASKYFKIRGMNSLLGIRITWHYLPRSSRTCLGEQLGLTHRLWFFFLDNICDVVWKIVWQNAYYLNISKLIFLCLENMATCFFLVINLLRQIRKNKGCPSSFWIRQNDICVLIFLPLCNLQ